MSLILNNKKHVAGILCLGVRNGSKNMSTWLNTLKYNLSDTIKKWYLFPDLGVVCTTKYNQFIIMKKALLYIHEKNGKADEADRYKKIFPNYDIVGLDYKGNTPWDTKEEFIKAYLQFSERYKTIDIIANSIGAYFAMNALSAANINKAFFYFPDCRYGKTDLRYVTLGWCY